MWVSCTCTCSYFVGYNQESLWWCPLCWAGNATRTYLCVKNNYCVYLAVSCRWRQFRAGATKRLMNLGDYKFMYLEQGEASSERPTVLLLHGFTSGKEEWSEIMRLLRPHCHVIAIDMPGHGETTRNPRGDHSVTGTVARIHQVSPVSNLHGCTHVRFYPCCFYSQWS